MSIAAILRKPATEAIALIDPFDPRLEGELYMTQVCDQPVTDEDVVEYVKPFPTNPLRGGKDVERFRLWITERRLRTEGKAILVGGWAGTKARTLSTEAPTPFVLEGVTFPSLRLFYESLKVEPDARATFAADPRGSGHFKQRLLAKSFAYGGATIAVGSIEHFQLIARATSAKVNAHAEVRRDLLATGRARLFMGHANSQPLGRVVPFAYMIERYRLGPSP